MNHNGGELLNRCLQSLQALEWPNDRIHIVVADNASTDNSLDSVPTGVEIIEMGTNAGFGAAINRAVSAPGPAFDAVLLLNPDAWIEPDALEKLRHVLDTDPGVGAACPRILFDRPMATVTITADEGMDCRLGAAEVDGTDVRDSVHGLEGAERTPNRFGTSTWKLSARSTLHVPHGSRLRVELEARRRGRVTIAADADPVTALVGPGATSIDVALGDEPLTVVQNDGSSVAADGTGTNRHFHRPLSAVDSRPADVFAWCGAGVLLRSAMLDQIGSFAEPFFLYYEDTDLAWRGQAAAWRSTLVPDAVVHHRHSATTGQGRAVTEVHQHRNRVLMMARNAPLGAALGTLIGLVLTAGSTTVRGCAARLRGSGDLTRAGYRWRSVVAALAKLPWALSTRRRLGRRARRPRRQVYAELEP
ncbi:MAG: glycosyltransferase [Acidimicrobiales bacterium]